MMKLSTLTKNSSRSVIHIPGLEKYDNLLTDISPDYSKAILPGYEKFAEKTYGVHRDFLIPKLEPSIQMLAKKFREMQIRERYLPKGIELVR